MSSEFPQPENEPAPQDQPANPPSYDRAEEPSSSTAYVPQYAPTPDPDSPSRLLPQQELEGNRGLVAFSWLIILGITFFIFASTTYIQFVRPEPEGPRDISKAELMQINLQGKMLLGYKLLFGDQLGAANPKDNSLASQIATMNTGPPESRYGAAILTNEFVDAAAALEQLAQVDNLIVKLNYEQTEKQQRLREIVGALFESYDDGFYDSHSIPEEDREFLKNELGWVGELALVPEKTPHSNARDQLENNARRSTLIGWSAFFAIILALLAGMLTAFAFLVMTVSGNVKPKFRPQSRRGRIYAETFAIWFVLFWGAQFALAVFANDFLTDVQAFVAVLFVFFASLMVLVWPVARGIPFSDVREDIGWKLKNPFVEGAIALVSYISVLPFLAGSLVVMMIIIVVTTIFQQDPDANELSSVAAPGHPIQEQFAAGDPTLIICAFVALCIAAPIVEETMFRGVLYRHLRDATTGWQKYASVIFSAVLSGLVFAAVHPQGLIGLPLLSTLAIGFALVREWRESLVAPMIMHAINNGCVATLLFLIL